jgi:hypothetical protein
MISQVNTCSQVNTNGWPAGQYLLSSENGVGLSYCLNGAKTRILPFVSVGTPLMYWNFEKFDGDCSIAALMLQSSILDVFNTNDLTQQSGSTSYNNGGRVGRCLSFVSGTRFNIPSFASQSDDRSILTCPSMTTAYLQGAWTFVRLNSRQWLFNSRHLRAAGSHSPL